ncbi:MAG: hypothetical protein K9K66_10115 [Desulfarculaceae bacterium]|nr:hypothetical protein [Desulfarculaceae bacterium]MCF8073762.1 hypothetical protein [Desulfarculaceae bacterium]MCF8102003.1 hypothetical protein [Desulfarculaceae bacterium]MCF8115973.1 hypothetical protein [Desulfarculaceae bacterium]
MRYLPLLCLACLLALPAPLAASDQFGSFSLTLENDSAATVAFRVNQGRAVELPPGRSDTWSRGFDADSLAASPTYAFRVNLAEAGGGPSCAARLVVEITAWGDDYLFSCRPRREVLGPCLITCDYDNVGPDTSAKIVFRPGP